MGQSAPSSGLVERREQPLLIRLTHWLNLPLMAVMAMSGLQILAAYPYLGPRGALFDWYPLQGWVPPEWLRMGGWLAGGRALHFAAMWFLVMNAGIYLGYFALSGEWRRRVFLPRRDSRNAIGTALHYAHVRPDAPAQGFYNGLQRLGYSSAVALGVLLVLSGLAIWKPVQLDVLAMIFGGYDGARAVHLLALAGLALFTVGHVLMVLLHPRTFMPMVTGGAKHVPTRDLDQA